MRDLRITGGTFGALYAAATILSALLLIRFGHRIDRKPLRPYTRRTVTLLSMSTAALGLAVHPVLLAPALLGLRFSGQGLMSHISQTVMARHFDTARGKALSVSALGYSIGEMVLPIAITALIPILGWRITLGLSGMVIAVMLLSFISALPLEEYQSGAEKAADIEAAPSPTVTREVLGSSLFWVLAPTFFVISFSTTGVFFYQLLIVEERGWSPELYAAAFGAYALTRFLVSLGGGVVVDRLTARRLYPLHLLPLLCGFIILGLNTGPSAARFFLILAGITMGTSGTIKSAILAEVFGKEDLGTVRSVFTAVAIMGTALGPLIFGIFLDWDYSFDVIIPGISVLTALGAANSFRLWIRGKY
jgi:MFS family permease